MDGKLNNIEDIDVNSPDFYEKVHNEIETDMARMKKSVEVIMKLRMEAAEIEVEQAALFHAELWYDLQEIENESDEILGEVYGEIDENTQVTEDTNENNT